MTWFDLRVNFVKTKKIFENIWVQIRELLNLIWKIQLRKEGQKWQRRGRGK